MENALIFDYYFVQLFIWRRLKDWRIYRWSRNELGVVIQSYAIGELNSKEKGMPYFIPNIGRAEVVIESLQAAINQDLRILLPLARPLIKGRVQ